MQNYFCWLIMNVTTRPNNINDWKLLERVAVFIGLEHLD